MKPKGLNIVVHFGERFPSNLEGPALLAFERVLREQLKVPAKVFKETMADDSKLRSMMTPEERAKL